MGPACFVCDINLSYLLIVCFAGGDHVTNNPATRGDQAGFDGNISHCHFFPLNIQGELPESILVHSVFQT